MEVVWGKVTSLLLSYQLYTVVFRKAVPYDLYIVFSFASLFLLYMQGYVRGVDRNHRQLLLLEMT